MLSNLEKMAMESVAVDNMMASVQEIARYERLSGSPAEYLAFQELERKMAGYGFETSLIQHDAHISLPKAASLRLLVPAGLDITCITHSAAASTPKDGVTAEIVWAGDGSDIPKLDVRGKFVMVLGLASPHVAVLAAQGGALGQIYVNLDEHLHDMTVQSVWGNPDDRTIAEVARTPAVSIARADGNRIRELLTRGPVSARMVAEVETGWTTIPQLECSLYGHDGTGDYLMISGHVDSWYYGAMDNGSANATMMEVGRVLATMRERLLRGVKICFWSGHSHGRYAGSAWYCDQHWHEINRHCIMHLNTDSTGAINATNLRRASIMAETQNIGKWAIDETMGIRFEGSRVGRNGDQSFWGTGVPSMFVSLSSQTPAPDGSGGGLGWWWHNPADLPDKIDPANLLRDTKIYALVATRLVTAPVLPFDYSRTIDEWLETAARVQSEVVGRFDLSHLADVATPLKADLAQLADVAARATPGSAELINRCLLRLGRALIPVSFTRAGQFAHDPAITVPFLPDIVEVLKITATVPGSDAEKQLRVRLIRGCNRVLEALFVATEIAKETLDQVW